MNYKEQIVNCIGLHDKSNIDQLSVALDLLKANGNYEDINNLRNYIVLNKENYNEVH